MMNCINTPCNVINCNPVVVFKRVSDIILSLLMKQRNTCPLCGDEDLTESGNKKMISFFRTCQSYTMFAFQSQLVDRCGKHYYVEE